MKRWHAALLGALLICGGRAQAALVTYDFGCISTGVAAECAVGAAQIRMDVRDTALDNSALVGQVLFVFRNVGPAQSSITDLYFDDGTLLGIASVQNIGSGVDFSVGASPGNLPGGNSLTPKFTATAGFTADSNPPTAPNGVNPGEQVAVLFNLVSGLSYFNVLSALNGQTVDLDGVPALRVGVHVQAFASGESASFVASPVPLPASALLLLGGLSGFLLRVRRRQAA